MPRSTPRATALNPSAIISLIEKQVREKEVRGEVFIRRAISTLYFVLFNYWAAKKYDSGKRGKGPYQDQWPLKEFNSEMLYQGLDAQIIFLYSQRVAADHYALNPTKIELWDFSKKIKIGSSINVDNLKRGIECAKEIYKVLD